MTDVLFVTTERKNAASHRRHRRLLATGANVTVLETYIDKSKAGYFRRIPHFAAVIARIAAHRNADAVWAWGLDACLASSIALSGGKSKLIWDVSDLLAFQLEETNRFGAVMRQLERVLLRRADRLVLSSPGFIDAYYGARVSQEKISIIENLLEAEAIGDREAFGRSRAPAKGPKLRVAYAGIFRSSALLEILADPASNPGGHFEFHLHGVCSRGVDPKILDRFDGTLGRYYHGPYVDPKDLPAIYRDADLVFSLLDTNIDDNERVLLPNRFYHAGFFGVPILATSNTFLGNQVITENMGICVENTASDIARALTALLDADAREALRKKLPPPSRFAFTDEHARILELVRRG